MIKFLNSEHEQRYNECINKDRTNEQDHERIAMFYILSSDKDIYKRINQLYIFSENAINIDGFFKIRNELSSSSAKMVYLAYQLYNNFKYRDFDERDLTILDMFAGLDKDNFEVCCYALKLRFNIN